MLPATCTTTLPSLPTANGKKKTKKGKEKAVVVNSTPPTGREQLPSPEAAHMTCHWTPEDESALIAFLVDHKAEAGDGMNFKTSTWKAAVAEMEKHRAKGATKGHLACKNKYAQVCQFLLPGALTLDVLILILYSCLQMKKNIMLCTT